MSSSPTATAVQVRASLTVLSAACREMTPAGAKPIPLRPERFNLLARPVYRGTACHICALPGHSSPNIKSTAACRVALLSLIGFWEDAVVHISTLYGTSERFKAAVVANEPTYEMRLDDGGLKGGDIENVLVERLTRGWLKFVSHVQRIRARVNVVLDEGEVGRYVEVERNLNGFLMDGVTLSELFERSLAGKE